MEKHCCAEAGVEAREIKVKGIQSKLEHAKSDMSKFVSELATIYRPGGRAGSVKSQGAGRSYVMEPGRPELHGMFTLKLSTSTPTLEMKGWECGGAIELNGRSEKGRCVFLAFSFARVSSVSDAELTVAAPRTIGCWRRCFECNSTTPRAGSRCYLTEPWLRAFSFFSNVPNGDVDRRL